jgi:hypothetical protein
MKDNYKQQTHLTTRKLKRKEIYEEYRLVILLCNLGINEIMKIILNLTDLLRYLAPKYPHDGTIAHSTAVEKVKY